MGGFLLCDVSSYGYFFIAAKPQALRVVRAFSSIKVRARHSKSFYGWEFPFMRDLY
jgi:hypothetical protein